MTPTLNHQLLLTASQVTYGQLITHDRKLYTYVSSNVSLRPLSDRLNTIDYPRDLR